MDYRGAFWQVILLRDANFLEDISYLIGAQKPPLGLTCCSSSLLPGIFGGELRDLTPDYPSSVKSCLTFSLTLNRALKGNLWGSPDGELHLMPEMLSMKYCLSDPENYSLLTYADTVNSVVHEPSGLEPDSSPGVPRARAGSSLLATGLLAALGGSNRGPRADSSLLAARVGSGRGPRALVSPSQDWAPLWE